jgi:hypothetical protein
MNTISIECGFCKKTFDKHVNQYNRAIKYKKNNFCSLSCSAKFNIIQIKDKSVLERAKYLQNPIKCKVCSSIIEYEYRNIKKFCSQSCSSTFNNKIRIRNAKNKTNNILNCLHCGKIGIRNKFCSIKCANNSKSLEARKEAFEKIKINQLDHKNNRRLKEFIRHEKGNICQMCNLTEWGGKPILLILDHIDGNSNNCSLKNLRLICSNCDTLTPTYKGKNRGKGRFLRRIRYKQNKSF